MDDLFKATVTAVIGVAVGAFWKAISGAYTRIRDLESANLLSKQDLSNLKGQIDSHSNDMKEIREKVNQIENSITAVGAKVDAMAHTLNQIYEQLQHR